ncbi:protein translocase subunit SecF [Halapricum hydrolyticum]|uniref:Protein-export membrane protein SecF n=1 Tax=Halapricum hydrolyticum TaxID=2979991 RepID=A0AAE3LEU7_9EURY|nr:protein translocase subunit SecF [Halapricum hydrolyticum]MCU4717614.1 protein translocase subunit SecF [Halapricum hydrolyticum]MCU4726857.1 protein translocase subunit SecF [Halapricum hydrolyticum]
MVEFDVPEIDYDRYSNRQLAGPPLAVLGFSLLVLVVYYLLHGTPVPLGFDFTGGTELRIATDAGQSGIREAFDAPIDSIRPVQGSNEYIVTFLDQGSSSAEAIKSTAEAAGFDVQRTSTRSAAFGTTNQQNALLGLALAFAGMSVFVFALFRTFVPSIAVVISAFSDIVIPLAIMDLLALTGLFDINLSLGTVAALLMLIGYSVDSDILLNNHILRRRGSFYESTYNAMQTGVTMTLTSIAAMIVMTLVSSILSIPLLPDIGLILVFGLTADLMNTYMLNLSLLRWYKFEGVAR